MEGWAAEVGLNIYSIKCWIGNLAGAVGVVVAERHFLEYILDPVRVLVILGPAIGVETERNDFFRQIPLLWNGHVSFDKIYNILLRKPPTVLQMTIHAEKLEEFLHERVVFGCDQGANTTIKWHYFCEYFLKTQILYYHSKYFNFEINFVRLIYFLYVSFL